MACVYQLEFSNGKKYIGQTRGAESKARMSEAGKNRVPISEEHKKALSKAVKAWWANPVTKASRKALNAARKALKEN